MLNQSAEEVRRIKEAYGRRRDKDASPYSMLFSLQREEEIEKSIRKHGISLGDKKVLDVGCGSGMILKYLLGLGASAKNLHGIDLLPGRIDNARGLNPGMHFICDSADTLPYPDKSFDIVTQFTVFTSILDKGLRKRIASEMVRVLRPGGMIIWHDYRFDNPFNPDVKGIRKREVMGLFPGCEYDFRLVHLNPFIGRPIARISPEMCRLLERISFLRSHWMISIREKGSTVDDKDLTT